LRITVGKVLDLCRSQSMCPRRHCESFHCRSYYQTWPQEGVRSSLPKTGKWKDIVGRKNLLRPVNAHPQ
jgi:hypothetical protein